MPAYFDFPYKFARLETGLVPYPIVPVFLKTPAGMRRFDFIIDTGADFTTLPNYMIKILGLDKNTLVASFAQGIGGNHVRTLEGKINMEFCRKIFYARCSFTDNDSTPLLLGKIDIFDKFEFHFRNKDNKLVVIPF